MLPEDLRGNLTGVFYCLKGGQRKLRWTLLKDS